MGEYEDSKESLTSIASEKMDQCLMPELKTKFLYNLDSPTYKYLKKESSSTAEYSNNQLSI